MPINRARKKNYKSTKKQSMSQCSGRKTHTTQRIKHKKYQKQTRETNAR